MGQDAEQSFFQMSGISKSYGGAVALDHADLAVRAGRIHAVLGENGAVKSTLLKVMSGVVQPDEGTMHLDGRQVSFASPSEANAAGVAPADGRAREGAGARAAHPDPRRGDLGADRGRRGACH